MSTLWRRIGVTMVMAWGVCPLMAGSRPVFAESAPAKMTPAQEEFFEKQVRPILVSKCVDCHGPDLQESGVRVDGYHFMVEPKERKAVVVPKKPDQSKLIEVIKYKTNIKMPPDEALKPEEVSVLEAWVSDGALWPETSAPPPAAKTKEEKIADARKEHWAYQPVQNPPLPKVKEQAFVQQPLDAFVVNRLEAAGLTPSKSADKRTLIRRAYFDLTGLPPSRDEIEAFEKDNSPDAFAKVVDKLLASPHFGERWARHWMDVARYSDTKGYVGGGRDTNNAFAYTYREYLVKAFNTDMPYDQFLVDQLAADATDLEGEQWRLAALGFLTVGNKFIFNKNNIIDDQIDSVTRGMLGLTVACARCHDHKYDAIPTEDYYALYGVFRNCDEPEDLPVIETPADTPEYREYEKAITTQMDAYRNFVDEKFVEMQDHSRRHVGDYLLAHYRNANPKDPKIAEMLLTLGPNESMRSILDRYIGYLRAPEVKSGSVFGPWLMLTAVPLDKFAEESNKKIDLWAKGDKAGLKTLPNPILLKEFTEKRPKTPAELAKIYNDQFVRIWDKWLETVKADPKADKFANADEESLRQILVESHKAPVLPENDKKRFLFRKDWTHAEKLKTKAQKLHVDMPGAPRRAMVVVDSANCNDARVLKRGNPGAPGDVVKRRFIEVLDAGQSPFVHGSGRLDLAEKIASKENPLTARVWVNRVWQHLFAEGLVRTPSDFGVRSSPPANPELLDYLASQFMNENWSTKKLLRQILLSHTYQQSNEMRKDCFAKDPENFLVWRMNPRRLDFEAQRDAILAVSGEIDLTLNGRSVDMWTEKPSNRRSIYGWIDRSYYPSLLRNFDVAAPDFTLPQRFQTTVPQQALFLMNSPFVLDQSRRLAARPEIREVTDSTQRVRNLYELAYGREPTKDEIELSLSFVDYCTQNPSHLKSAPDGWDRLAQVLLMSNEFVCLE